MFQRYLHVTVMSIDGLIFRLFCAYQTENISQAYFIKWIVLTFLLGKTTLADSLIASNGIISTRLAGKVISTIISYVLYATSHTIKDRIDTV